MSAEDALHELKEWLEHNGGYFHPHVHLQKVASGFSVVASESLPPDSKIVSCPFTLAITKHVALQALSVLLGSSSKTQMTGWSERQLISSYLSFHWIIGDDKSSTNVLAHLPYVKSLPSRDKLRTPLHFTAAELDRLKGSNLYGATIDRDREWRTEWTECQEVIGKVNGEWGDQFTWELYLTAATHLSSRAFSSTLISQNLSLTSPSVPEPILLPGVDSLNHARAEPVSWVQSYLGSGPIPDAGSCISLTLHNPAAAGAELFNNYGPKPNSELILGYGFSLPNVSHSTTSGTSESGRHHCPEIGGMAGGKWEVGRDARGADGVWDSVLAALQEGDEPTYDDHLDTSDALADMVQALLDKLPELDNPAPDDVREDREILESLIEYAGAKEWLGTMPTPETEGELE
ncbi:SET domain protein [Mycena leptocephala]|nr:SET domain protein [Mycena leptocephala]